MSVRRILLLSLLFGACSGDCGADYAYPRTTPGKEPIANAAQVRVNQSALDFVTERVPQLMTAVCCDYDTLATHLETPAESCWGKGPCFIESVTGKRRVHFYLGAPSGPLAFDVSSSIHLDIRNGDPITTLPVSDDTDDADDRPYCNDVSAPACLQQQSDLARFCWKPSEHTQCNDPEHDFCCGGLYHGGKLIPFGDPTDPLDICSGDRVVGRCTGYPSNIVLDYDQLAAPSGIQLTVLPAANGEPAGLDVWLHDLDIGVDMILGVPSYDVPVIGNTNLACKVSDSSSGAVIEGANIRFSLRPRFSRPAADKPLALEVCPDCLSVTHFEFTLNAPDLQTDARDPYCQDEVWATDHIFPSVWASAAVECNIGCGLANFASDVVDPLFDAAQGLIQKPLVSAISSAIVGGLNGISVETRARMKLQDLFALPIELRYAQPIGLLASPSEAGFSGQDAGLRLSLDVGLETDAAACVPNFSAPVPLPVSDPELPALADGKPYHAAAAISLAAIERVLFNVVKGGFLCLGMGSQEIFALTDNQLTITAGTLYLLAPDLQRIAEADAPIFFQIEPREAPRVSFGATSLLDVALPALDVSLFVFSDGRMVRLFTVNADLALGLSLAQGPSNTLLVTVDKLDIPRVAQTFSVLTKANFGDMVSVLLNLVTTNLFSNRLSFQLPTDALIQSMLPGLPVVLKVNAVQRLASDHVAAFFTMCDEADALDTQNTLCCDNARTMNMCGHSARATDALSISRAPRQARGKAFLNVHGRGTAFAARVDGGAYHSLRALDNGVLSIEDPWLLLPGKHSIEVSTGPVLSLETAVIEYETFAAATAQDAPIKAQGCACRGGAQPPLLLLLILAARALYGRGSRSRSRRLRARQLASARATT